MPAMLHIEPQDALIDVERDIRIDGLEPGEVVTVSSRSPRGGGVAWTSRIRVAADAGGTVSLRRDAPLDGSYEGAHPMGLCWSQVPETEGARELFPADVLQPIATAVTVARGTGERWERTFIQRLAAPGVRREEVRGEGLVGTLFHPEGPGPHPAIMILNGSGGGINEPRAALWASHGFTAFALGYFKAPGLSPYISNTPLEYFETGLRWLRRGQRPLGGFVAIAGQSRGGELVMLLGSRFPELVDAVLGYVPSAVVNCAQNACDPALGREGHAWLHEGRGIPHIWGGNREASWEPWDSGPEPRRHSAALLTSLRDPAAVERARIPVERIRGPVLLLSASDDGAWPSTVYCEMIKERLAQHRHPYPVEHHEYPGGGHSILFPHVPTTQLTYRHPVSGRTSTTGGTPPINAHADAHSWRAALAFTRKAVRDHLSRNTPT